MDSNSKEGVNEQKEIMQAFQNVEEEGHAMRRMNFLLVMVGLVVSSPAAGMLFLG